MKFSFYSNFTSTPNLSLQQVPSRSEQSAAFRIPYVDDATAMEIIPGCSPSYLPFRVSDIYTYASLRGMKLKVAEHSFAGGQR